MYISGSCNQTLLKAKDALEQLESKMSDQQKEQAKKKLAEAEAAAKKAK